MLLPRVSILLPTYNRGKIIKEAIDAVINQDYPDWELIILDDCSTDNTQEIGKHYVENYDNIRYHRNSVNIMQPGNRNIGLSLAKGELIFFIEDDLVVNKQCLALLVETYDRLKLQNKVGGVMPRLVSILQDQLKYEGNDPIIFSRFTGEMYINYWVVCNEVKETITTHACTLYPKKILIEVGGYPEHVYIGNCYREESDLNFRVLHQGYHFYYQPEAWAFHNVQKFGGCHDFSFLKHEYYKIRNHIVFLIRIFKIKALYMIPLFLIDRIIKTQRFVIFRDMDL